MSAWVKTDSGTALAEGLKQLPECGQVFCDWLDVTFNPSEDLSWLPPLLASAGATSPMSGRYTFTEGGVIKHQMSRRWQRLSISGAALAVLRGYQLFNELLALISQYPYKVTRIDAALDLAVDASPVVTRLWDVYKRGGVKLNVWNTLSTQSYFGTRFDGVLTGTFYAGNRRVNKVTARVYDKQHEVYERHKAEIGPRVRYELTVKTDQVTLRDVSDPTALFWHYINPSLLKAPDGVPLWSAGNPYAWEGEKMAPLSVQDRLHRVVYGTGDLNAAMAICGSSAGMFEYLVKLVRLRILERASRLPDWSSSYE